MQVKITHTCIFHVINSDSCDLKKEWAWKEGKIR